WNEERKISVAVSSLAKHGVELTLHIFPNAVAPGTNHHAATHVARLSQLGRTHHLLIPLRKIFHPPGTDRRFLSIGIRHRDNELSCRTRNDQRRFARPTAIPRVDSRARDR